MQLQFKLEKDDFLTYQLFAASKSEQIRKRRRRTRIMLILTWILFVVAFYFLDGRRFAVIFGTVYLLVLATYPFRERRLYRRHYEKHVEEILKNRFGKGITLILEEDKILEQDYMGESSVLLSELEQVDEIPDYFFLKFNSGIALIIPKHGLEEREAFESYLKGLEQRLNIKHNIYPDWKWK